MNWRKHEDFPLLQIEIPTPYKKGVKETPNLKHIIWKINLFLKSFVKYSPEINMWKILYNFGMF